MAVAFPLRVSPNGRYLIDANGVPFPILNYQFWSLPCVSSSSDLTSIVTKLQSLKVTAVTCYLTTGSGAADGNGGTWNNQLSPDMSGNLPFTKNQNGTSYTGATGQADVSQTNSAYLTTVSNIFTTLGNAGILVFFFPAYLGFSTGSAQPEGLGGEMVGSGASKCTTFGQNIASVFTHTNIVWMAYGDDIATDVTGLKACHDAFWAAIKSNATQSPLLIGGHYPSSDGRPTSPNNSDSPVNGYVNLNSVYVQNVPGPGGATDDSPTYTDLLTASGQTPVIPAWRFDDPLYEHDPFAGSIGVLANDVRKRWWWTALSGTAGAGWGNELCSNCGSPAGASGTFTYANCNVTNGFQSDGHTQLAISTSLYTSLPWWKLLPSGVGPVGTIVTAGGGASGTQTFIVSAADPLRSCVAAYMPPGLSASSTVTIDMTKCGKNASAYWVDPTNGARQYIGSFANTGTRVFTTPSSNNAYGATDWVLFILATPDPISRWMGQ